MDELVARVAAGDRAAFELLYRELADTAYVVAHATLQDSAQAEEVAQEVFLEIWRTAGRYEPERGTARRWVRIMARNRAIDRVRTVTSARARDQLVLATPDRVIVDPEEVVLEQFARQGLLRAMRLLSTEHRTVLVLTYFAELSQSQVAAVLEIPVGTVKSRLSSALRQLRKGLEPDSWT